MITRDLYDEIHVENTLIANRINAAWGARVAWVEDRQFPAASKLQAPITLPVVVSRLVNGLLDGMRAYPAFRSARQPPLE